MKKMFMLFFAGCALLVTASAFATGPKPAILQIQSKGSCVAIGEAFTSGSSAGPCA